MTDVMDTGNLPIMRPGPVRASSLRHPRLPRHLLKQQQGEADEQKMGGKLADQGDGTTEQSVALPDKKGMSVVEKHQLQAPAQMLAQLRRNSLESACQRFSTLSSAALSQDRAMPHAEPQAQSNGTSSTVSSFLNRAEGSEQRGIRTASPAKRRQLMTDLLDQKRSKLEQTDYSEPFAKPPASVDAEDQDMRSLRVKVQRSLSLETNDQQSQSPQSDDDMTYTHNTPYSTFARRNSLHDLRSLVTSDSGLLNSQLNASMEAVNCTASKAHQPFLKYPLPHPKTENQTAASTYLRMASYGEDLGRMGGGLFSKHSEHSAATRRASSYEDLKFEPLSIIRANASKDCERRVKDLEGMMETFGNMRGGGGREKEEQPNHVTPVFKRQIVAKADGSYPKKTERKQAPAPLNFCKLELKEGDQSYFVLLVAPAMDKLMAVNAMLNDARIVKCGMSNEDLLDELGDQMGAQLMMQKLHSLPPGGKYSVQKLLSLSTSHFSHCKPNQWEDIVARFGGQGIDGLLLRTEEVTYFQPSDYRPVDGRLFRSVDNVSRSVVEKKEIRAITGRFIPG